MLKGEFLKFVFNGDGRVDVPAFGDEVATDFEFGADTEIEVVQAFDGVEVVPELGFGEENEFGVLPWSVFHPVVGKA